MVVDDKTIDCGIDNACQFLSWKLVAKVVGIVTLQHIKNVRRFEKSVTIFQKTLQSLLLLMNFCYDPMKRDLLCFKQFNGRQEI